MVATTSLPSSSAPSKQQTLVEVVPSTASSSASSSQRPRLRRTPTEIAVELATETCSTASVLNSVAAGYAAGITGTLVGHPLDSAKVWLQTNRNPTLAGRIQASTVSATTSATSAAVRSMSTVALTPNVTSQLSQWTGTVRALYKGITGPLLTVGMVQSINFAVYDSCRRMLFGWDHPAVVHGGGGGGGGTKTTTCTAFDRDYRDHDSLWNVALSSMVAGSVLACFTSPMLIIKTQQQVKGHSYRQAVQEMLRPVASANLQWKNLFVGFGIHSFSEVAGRAVYFVTYEHLKRQFLTYRQEQDETVETVSLQDRMLAAASSGIVCWAAIFPIDAVRCRLYAQQPGLSRQTALEMARSMHQAAGWRAFYRGFGVTVLRAGPVAAAVLPIYDIALERLSAME